MQKVLEKSTLLLYTLPRFAYKLGPTLQKMCIFSWKELYYMCIINKLKEKKDIIKLRFINWKDARSLAALNLWHFLWYATFLSGLPLFLAITFSLAAGSGWDSLTSRYLTDVLLTTFALAICVCGESTQPSYNKNPSKCRDISFGSSLICLAIYFAFYHMENVITKIFGEDIWQSVKSTLTGEISLFFKLSLVLYIINLLIGIYINKIT